MTADDPTTARGGRLLECPDCGLVQRRPEIGPGQAAICGRCHAVLWRPRRDALRWSRVLSVTGLILYAIAIWLPFMDFYFRGRGTTTTLVEAAASFEGGGAWELAVVLAATVIVMPIVKLLVLATVSFGLRLEAPPRWLHVPFRWYARLSPWGMIEVYLIGVFVAYTRLSTMAHVEVGPAGYALAALMLVMVAADATLDRETTWEELERVGATACGGEPPPRPEAAAGGAWIGCRCCDLVSAVPPRAAGAPGPAARCPRCGARLAARKPESVARTWAMLLAAAALYVPANLYPVMNITSLGHTTPTTIFGGVQELVAVGMVPIAILVFVASITVPTLKLVGLVIMLVSTQRHWGRRLRDRTRLYRIVDVIGRWSMIDIFMLSVLVSLVRFGFLANVTPGLGAVCFAAVVVLTMLAAGSFDPRLMWDAAPPDARDAPA